MEQKFAQFLSFNKFQSPSSLLPFFFFPSFREQTAKALHSDREIFRLYLVIKTSRSKNYLRAASEFQRHRQY